MKGFKLVAPLAATAALLTGCLVTSVYPYYYPKDVAFDPALAGNWSDVKEADNHWKFEAEGTKGYRLTYTADSKSYAMQAVMFKLDGNSFLDLFTTESKDEIQPPPIPAHFLLRVYQVGPTLKMAPLNYEWLSSLVEKEPKAVRHHVTPTGDKPDDVRIVLTADTAELQQFIRKHLKTGDAWKEGMELKRDSATAGSQTQGKK